MGALPPSPRRFAGKALEASSFAPLALYCGRMLRIRVPGAFGASCPYALTLPSLLGATRRSNPVEATAFQQFWVDSFRLQWRMVFFMVSPWGCVGGLVCQQ